ncbi:VWA domain-containing protein [Deinococcus sp. YIM 77859]|uniref:vWA domain-containing protein n=1 Tax=Deinococcus sp. YIM 77859 TaxID=1540221 RepID=UPI00068B218F|nr:VWA domain-containing protein [Deinococcus sp. YIM 77859]
MHPAAALTAAVLLVGASAQPGSLSPSGAVPGVTLRRAPAAPACTLPSGALPSRTRAVFVLDTSGSMRGIGDGRADIFERVKGAINAYVRSERPDRVELFTFDSGLRARRSYVLPRDHARWNRDLAALRADGQNTYLYRSLAQALAPLAASELYATTVFVLTDGIDNDPDPDQTAARALGPFVLVGRSTRCITSRWAPPFPLTPRLPCGRAATRRA